MLFLGSLNIIFLERFLDLKDEVEGFLFEEEDFGTNFTVFISCFYFILTSI